MLESNRNDFIAAGSLGRRGRMGLLILVGLSGAACVGLGGCATTAAPLTSGLNADFGQSVAHNRAAQFVPPTTEQKQNTYIRPNANRQRLALETYEAGEVELDESAVGATE